MGQHTHVIDKDLKTNETFLHQASIADPGLPEIVKREVMKRKWPDELKGVAVSDSHKVLAVVSKESTGVRLHTTVTHSVGIGQVGVFNFGGGTFDETESVDVTTPMGYIDLYDLSKPVEPVPMGRGLLTTSDQPRCVSGLGRKDVPNGSPLRVAMAWPYAYVLTTNHGLQVVDLKKVADKDHEVQIIQNPKAGLSGTRDVPGSLFRDDVVVHQECFRKNPVDLVVVGELLYVLGWENLFVFDIREPQLPQKVMAADLGDQRGFRLAVATDLKYRDAAGNEHEGDVAFVSGGGTISIYDVTYPPREGKNPSLPFDKDASALPPFDKGVGGIL